MNNEKQISIFTIISIFRACVHSRKRLFVNTIQYNTAKQIQSHSTYTTGTVTKLYATPKRDVTTGQILSYSYYVQYTFIPFSNNRKYSETYGINKNEFIALHKGSLIGVYYDTQNPNLQNVAGYQSSQESLLIIAVVFAVIFILLVIGIAMLSKRARNTKMNTNKDSDEMTNNAVTLPSNTPSRTAQELSAPVWFFYPQTGGIISFKRHFLSGTLSVANNQLTIDSYTQGEIINCHVSEIRIVKRWAPVMTFYFNDSTKLQVDFHDTRQNRRAVFGLFGAMSSLASKNYKEALINIKPFEDYFAQLGLLQ